MSKTPENGLTTQYDQENFEEGACRERILVSLAITGFKEKIDEELMKRLVLLEQGSEFDKDASQVERGVANLLNYLEEYCAQVHPEFVLSPEQKVDGRMAARLHDIGKSGPVDATKEQQEAVIKVFALERVNGFDRSVEDVVTSSFNDAEAKKLLGNLLACSIDERMPMRQFWNLHAKWTYDILIKHPAGLSNHIQAIAGSHHLDNGINPRLQSKVPTQSKSSTIESIGGEVDNLELRVLMVIDKYQALIRRSLAKHEEAITWVRGNLVKYDQDNSLQLIIEAVDQLGKQNRVFA